MADPVTWQRIEEILDQVLDLPREERQAFVEQECTDDTLRAEVESLLQADQQAEGFLAKPAGEYAATLLDERAADSGTLTTDLPPRRFGPYRVVREIGRGGMGVVFEAVDTRLGRHVAVKILPVWSGGDPSTKERFLREARAVSMLEHANICAIHDIGENDDGRLYIVMPYYPGESLEQRLERGSMPVDEARRIAVQLARGLERAHEAGITHRDIKPANVILTHDSGAKILDFGLAKIAGDAGLTMSGATLGTPAYMSPEQARGEPADARSDIWSLGVVLYRMLGGELPFRGDSGQAMIYSILNHEPEDLTSLRPEVTAELSQVVHKALVKDPATRYASISELRVDLESGLAPTPEPVSRRRGARLKGPIATLLVSLAGLGVWWAAQQRSPSLGSAEMAAKASVQSPVRSSLAVLYFQNLTGDQDLDWLRSGITEMLVTDLSQSPEIEVMSTARLYQSLEDLDALETTPSLDLLQKLSQHEAVDSVIQGSFARLGDVLRIIFTIQEASTGTILLSKRVEGRSVEGLFALVDELSATIRNSYEVTARPDRPETVQAVTTSSLEAWRYYTEGLALQHQAKEREAITMMQEAVRIDPDFALALVNLGRFHRNLREGAKAREYTRRALEHAKRLPIDMRLQVEGAYHGAQWTTYGLAVDAYEEAVRRRPDKDFLHSNLANRYFYLERYERAIEEYGVLIESDSSFGPVYAQSAWAHAALGRFETGYRILADRLEAQPDDWFVRAGLAYFLTQWGRLDEASAALEPALALRPSDSFVHWTAWRLEVLRGDWPRAEKIAETLTGLSDPWDRWRGATASARNLLYSGRSEAALDRFAEAAVAYPEPEAQTALARCWAADLLLERGDAARALTEARRAVEEGRGDWPERLGLFLAAQAEEQLGRSASADALVVELERLRQPSNQVEERQIEHLRGLLALERGDTPRALAALDRAAALLPPRGIEFHPHTLPDHVPIWSALGRAQLAAGDSAAAIEWFGKVATTGAERIEFPVRYVRSLYFLAQLHQQLGELEEAHHYGSRFLAYWRRGDLDREQVAEVTVALHQS